MTTTKSGPPTSQLYHNDIDFGATYQTLGIDTPIANFHLQDGLLCHLGHLYVPSSKHAKMIWEAHIVGW
jgi:hypothetical protein